LVVSLHGTYGFDSASGQIREWKALAERHGFIVAAPKMRSVQGILPVIRPIWYKDLARDEQTILGLLRQVKRDYRIARDPATGKDLIMLTGFSAGGYPMYYTGLRNPEKFSVLVARACNSDGGIFKRITVTNDVRKLRVIIYYGQSDLPMIGSQSWAAFRWLRLNGCLKAERHKTSGGHMRSPGKAWKYWADYLPRTFAQRSPGR
jgi:predicted esterase